jgi:hypothetical protein
MDELTTNSHSFCIVPESAFLIQYVHRFFVSSGPYEYDVGITNENSNFISNHLYCLLLARVFILYFPHSAMLQAQVFSQ